MGKSTRICSYDGCDKFAKTRSLCNGHYEQRRRGRGLAPLKMRSLTLKQRFWAKVNKAAPLREQDPYAGLSDDELAELPVTGMP